MELSALCQVCGGNYIREYYQRRSADEPPDVREYCPTCVLDVRRLSMALPQSVLYQGKNTSPTSNATLTTGDTRPRSYKKPSQGNRTCIEVKGRAALRCLDILESDGCTKSLLTSVTLPVGTGINQRLGEVFSGSVISDQTHITLDEEKIAPFFFMKTVEVLKVGKKEQGRYDSYVSGYEVVTEVIPYTSSSVVRVRGGKDISIYMVVKEVRDTGQSMESMVLRILDVVLTRYGSEESVKSFISPTVMSSMYTQSARAYDWPSAPERGYKFTWKPDGERMWCVRYGSVWFFARRMLSGRISGWMINETLTTALTAGPVLDLEVMIAHRPILIDVLVTENGLQTPPTRTLDYVIGTFKEMRERCIPVHLRGYKKRVEDLLTSTWPVNYPVDGIVGVEQQTNTIVKLKTTRSVELQLQPNGDLVTSDGVVVATSTIQNTYDPGSIVELRITSGGGDRGGTCVDQILQRTDKVKANSLEACRNTIHTMTEPPDSFERSRALTWCNSVRSVIHKMASSVPNRGRVIMVLGAGDGQEASDYSTDMGISYLLLEPDEKRSLRLQDRLGGKGKVRRVVGAAYFNSTVNILTKGAIKFAVLQATVSEVLGQEHWFRTMQSSIRCCVAPYSISHTSPEIVEIAVEGIPLIGCGYLYDGVLSDGSLVNESGVLMKMIDKSRAIVKWGSDKVFEETAVCVRDFSESIEVRLASDTVPVFRGENKGLLNTVSEHVYILSTVSF